MKKKRTQKQQQENQIFDISNINDNGPKVKIRANSANNSENQIKSAFKMFQHQKQITE